MDSADDGAVVLVGHVAQQGDALGGRHLVQTRGGFVKKENTGIGDHFQTDRQPFAFAPAQLLGGVAPSMIKVKSREDVCDQSMSVHVALLTL